MTTTISLENLTPLSSSALIEAGLEDILIDRKERKGEEIVHVVHGSRCEIDEINFLGNVSSVEVPTKEELAVDFYDENDVDDGEDPVEVAKQYLEEFYYIEFSSEEFADCLTFSYTEEGYDAWYRIAA